MKLRVVNCSDAELKQNVKSVVDYTVQKLFRKRKKLLKNLRLTIRIDNKKANEARAWGYCKWMDKNSSPRAFCIIMHENTSRKRFNETLIHELVHVKQYAKGELKDYTSGLTRWKKRVFEEDESSIFAIMSTPWEKEAYKMSEDIHAKYKKFVKNYTKPL